MSKFMNIVRSKVKEGKKDELMKKLKEFFDNMKGTDGLISMKLIQTGSNNMCTIGEWKDEQSIAKARDKMIAGLDTVRPLLEEISPALGVTPIIWNVSLPPKYGTITLSPLIKGTLSNASARYRSSIGGMASNGATIIFSAATALIFFTEILSPIAIPELFRPNPSILIIPFPSSDG